MDPQLKKAFEAAKKARGNAHSPYSSFRVGAALLLENGDIIPGCNVENSSYGGTICAERTAFCSAIATHGKIDPKAMVLVTEPEAMPCGMCLQVMSEFCSQEFPIYLSTPKGIGREVKLRELLPYPFGPDKLA